MVGKYGETTIVLSFAHIKLNVYVYLCM